MNYLLANSLSCLAIHLLAAAILTMKRSFDPEGPLFKERRWERGGALYLRLGIKKWKDRLPSCGGFDKKHFKGTDIEYLSRFVQETCRGEAIHLLVLLPIPLFFLFNPPAGAIIVAFYLILANLPCALAQRYNRIRLKRLCVRAWHALY